MARTKLTPLQSYNSVKFFAYNNAVQNLSNTFTKHGFNTIVFDTGSNFNTVNGRFTAPVAGFYMFNALTYCQSLTGNAYMSIYKNGASYIQIATLYANASDVAGTGSAIIQLAVNDYIEVWVSNSSGAAKNYYGAAGPVFYNYFQGYLISTT